ncbi:MAG: VIT1/CCC1 transporter family protein [Chitinispirillaceae bacterium]|nr:VIT1/CCC1 transporter family protein [Chitinispirillaceae bacterium]
MNDAIELLQRLLLYQKNEITEYHLYKKLAQKTRMTPNRQLLEKIADDELRHYRQWQAYTHAEVRPNRLKLWRYYWISRIFGLTFGVKLMERGEEDAQKNYQELAEKIPEAPAIIQEENQHELELLRLLDEEKLRYVGSIVLGLNDALVELTGALAGLTLALQNSKLIALTGSITGIAAALSMGSSEYLSTKTERSFKNPLRAAFYTGGTYMVTVLLLILPYLLLSNYYLCLVCMMAEALLIIAVFNFYIAITNDERFGRRFLEMASLSFAVAALSFLIGFLLRTFFNIEI